MKTRAQAALVIQQVLDQGQSLSAVLPAAQEKVAPRDRALLQELCYGTLRWLPRLDAAVGEMMDKPLKNKSRIFHYLILVGLYQLIYTRIPAHAAVAETVNAVKLLKGTSLRGLINGVLRNFQRSAEVILLRIDRVPSIRLGHPEWLTKRLRQAYPEDWEFIMEANNQRPPCGSATIASARAASRCWLAWPRSASMRLPVRRAKIAFCWNVPAT